MIKSLGGSLCIREPPQGTAAGPAPCDTRRPGKTQLQDRIVVIPPTVGWESR